jgi:hypothetical protein
VKPNNPLYVVIHPLDDVPEKKRDISGMTKLSGPARIIISCLQFYLILMMGLVVYEFIFKMSTHLP